MIDSHSHLNDLKLKNNISQIINDAKNVGVEKIVNVGYDLNSSIEAVQIAEQYKSCYAVVGIHPENAKEYSSEVESQLAQLLNNNKVVAIGEIGLDYYWDCSNKDLQKEVFEKQIKLAIKSNSKIIIHTRDAIGDTMEILRKYKDQIKDKFCVHCFNGSKEILNEIISLGGIISVGGVVTFKNATNLCEIVKVCPLDKLMLETDCPYLAPVPHRGEINEPKYIPLIANKIAEIKNIDRSIVKSETEKTTKNFFNIG